MQSSGGNLSSLAARQDVWVRRMPCSLPFQRAISQEAFYLEGWGQGGGDGRRAADLLSLGRQEAHLGIAWDSDVSRKRPGVWERPRRFLESPEIFCP